MAAAATPRGRPQYAALRDEIASSASGDRAPRSLTARQRNLLQTRALRLNDFERFRPLGAARGDYFGRPQGFQPFCSRKTVEILI